VPPRHYNAALPVRYDELFQRALSKAPEERFRDAAEFVTELNLKELEALVSLIGPPEPPKRVSVAVAMGLHQLETSVQTMVRPSASSTERLPSTAARRPLSFPILLIPLALFLGVGAFFFLGANSAGSLEVDSLPPGASLWVDGVEVGSTPMTLTELAPGEHEIAVVKEGFVRAREVIVTERDSSPLVFALQPARSFLSIASTPPQCAVLIDGKEVGSTPLSEVELEEGLHDIEVRRSGYESFRVRVEGRPGESLHYVARLKPVAVLKPVVENETPVNPPILPSLVAELGEPGVSPPKKLSGEFARYPETARRRKVSGVVTVSMIISESGVPEDLEVIESAGPLLDEAVLNAVAEWRFEPAQRDGRPVPLRYRMRQRFRLER
jgi:TonB family protein